VRVVALCLLVVPALAEDAVDTAVQNVIERKAISGASALIEHKGMAIHYSAHVEPACR
jgi:hypothetical protein